MNTINTTVLGHWAVESFGETSSFLIEAGLDKILLDACPGVCRQLHGVSAKLPEIQTALISHVHGDHLLGLPYFIFARTTAARSFAGTVEPLLVSANTETLLAAQSVLRSCYPDRDDFLVKWTEASASQKLKLRSCEISSFPVMHTVPTLAFRITCGTKSIGYTADTRPVAGLAQFLKNVDLLIVEAFGLRKDFEKIAMKQSHLLVEEASQLAAETQSKRALLFHMHLPYQDSERRDELISEFKRSYSGEVIFPTEFSRIGI